MAEIIFDKAKRVSSPLNISLNGGTTEGTNKFTYDGSSSKTLNITPSLLGAANLNHIHDIATTTKNGFLSLSDKKIIDSIGQASSLKTVNKQIVSSINEIYDQIIAQKIDMKGDYSARISIFADGINVGTSIVPLQNADQYNITITSLDMFGQVEKPVFSWWIKKYKNGFTMMSSGADVGYYFGTLHPNRLWDLFFTVS